MDSLLPRTPQGQIDSDAPAVVAWKAVFAESGDPGDSARVKIVSADGGQYVRGPYITADNVTPEEGKTCLVIYDNEGDGWIVAREA